LSTEQAAQNKPVLLRGVVTQAFPEWRGFSFQDSTDAIYVNLTNPALTLPHVGERVEVRGRTQPGNFAPSINADSITGLGHANFPRPTPMNWDNLSSGACDNQFVEVSAVVRSVDPIQPPKWRWRATAMHLDLGGNLIWAYIRDKYGLPGGDLVGSTIRIRGTCLILSNSRRQFERNALIVPDGTYVTVVTPPQSDPFTMPASRIDRLFAYQSRRSRVRVTGTAIWVQGNRLFLENQEGALQVRTTAPSSARPGQCLDIVGFPVPGVYSAMLEDALTRTCSNLIPIAPLRLTARGVLSYTRNNKPALPDGLLVRLAGTVLDVSRSAEEQTLTLDDGDFVFTARLTVHGGKTRGPILPEGTRIDVSGVCVIQVDDNGLPRNFELLLRSPADIIVVSRPSWFTRSRALTTLAILAATALLAILWVVMLRRRVRTQTFIIEQQYKREATLETRLRHLVEHASDMVFILNDEGEFLHVNYGTIRLTGHRPEELLRSSFFQLVVPDQRENAREILNCDLPQAHSGYQQYEWRLIRKDGVEIVVEISHRCETGDDGRVRIEAIGRDVTARQEARLQEQQRFRTLADNIPQLAWMANATGSIVWYNQRWMEYTRTSLDELTSQGWMSYLHPDHRERVHNTLLHSFQHGESWQDTFLLRGSDNEFRWFLGRAVPIRGSSGAVVRWFGTNTDITEQKQTESELQRSNEDLRQFAYIASHDLQEPLRNVSNFAQLFRRTYQNDGLSPQQKQYLDVITAGAQRMVTLITDLLEYSQATAIPGSDKHLVALQSVLDEVLINLDASVRQAGATITHDPLPNIAGNSAKLNRVLQNLVANALKYRRPGVPPRIHIGAVRQVDAWLISVQDNGTGFKPEYRERIFGIFKRLHGQEVPGTGIGLAICKAIIERSGGRIWAEGELGVGAGFYFTIPDSRISGDPPTTNQEPTSRDYSAAVHP
jgi:PAS domain S-box-containing protein